MSYSVVFHRYFLLETTSVVLGRAGGSKSLHKSTHRFAARGERHKAAPGLLYQIVYVQ